MTFTHKTMRVAEGQSITLDDTVETLVGHHIELDQPSGKFVVVAHIFERKPQPPEAAALPTYRN